MSGRVIAGALPVTVQRPCAHYRPAINAADWRCSHAPCSVVHAGRLPRSEMVRRTSLKTKSTNPSSSLYTYLSTAASRTTRPPGFSKQRSSEVVALFAVCAQYVSARRGKLLTINTACIIATMSTRTFIFLSYEY